LKDRFACWSCDWWGDEADLLRHFKPRQDYSARLVRLRRLREEYEEEGAEDLELIASRPPGRSVKSGRQDKRKAGTVKPRPGHGVNTIAPGRAGSTGELSLWCGPEPYEPTGSPQMAFASMTDEEREVILRAESIVARHKVTFWDLVYQCSTFAQWARDLDEQMRKEEQERQHKQEGREQRRKRKGRKTAPSRNGRLG
jgi:hypothetical protein